MSISSRIQVNADDFGKTETINIAVAQCFDESIIHNTTIMVTEPSFKQAWDIADNCGFKDKIGLHLNLDEGFPLTEEIKNYSKYCRSDGAFNGVFKKSIKSRICINDTSEKKVIREEIDAQIQRYLLLDSKRMHIDSHHYIHNGYGIFSILLPLAIDYKFKSMRMCHLSQRDSYLRKIYKQYINHQISRYLPQSIPFAGGYNDYLLTFYGSSAVCEIMVHPDMIDGKLVDVLDRNKTKTFDIKQYNYGK